MFSHQQFLCWLALGHGQAVAMGQMDHPESSLDSLIVPGTNLGKCVELVSSRGPAPLGYCQNSAFFLPCPLWGGSDNLEEPQMWREWESGSGWQS